ncbi:hypothetical protein B0H19DRAFT_1186124 [Mycena capillaripes]|nr:hypothetical protein B0H19DRAFT_1186124 [Mycena capillaripes]
MTSLAPRACSSTNTRYSHQLQFIHSPLQHLNHPLIITMSNLLEKGKQLLNNAGSGSTGTGMGNSGSMGNQGQDDYVDKGLAAFERKQGMPDNRATNEKITDGARNLFEKATGRDVPSKISN